ncbi:neuralized-like protein 2 [Clonorchis sinensis]|uniref:Neuralized-like protein 2 n=1 Tax=Clonorchis sinensis TaxID=79923 RepID=G7YDE9_CLOSI|nr:neuralized-like protein 2 [Clonorchis sinensis]
MSSQRFDLRHKGRYVAISAEGTMARRQSGFCDGLAVSERHIRPGELVVVEILETQPGWSGDLRIGFTLLPDQLLQPLPSFAIPELVSRGQSWIFPVGTAAAFLVSHRHRSYWRRQQKMCRSVRHLDSTITGDTCGVEHDTDFTFGSSNVPPFIPDHNPIQPSLKAPCMCCLHTGFGRVAFSRLMPIEASLARPPDVEKGSVVGIYYELEPITSPNSCATTPTFSWNVDPELVPAESDQPEKSPSQPNCPADSGDGTLCCRFRFHIVINGIDLLMLAEQLCVRPDQLCQTQSSSDQEQLINTSSGGCDTLRYPKFRAVFDVYGQTKAVQLLRVNQNPVAPLSRLCSCVILRCILRSQYFDWLEEPQKGLKPAKVLKSTVDSDSRAREFFADQHTSRSSAENVRTQQVFAALQSLPLPRSDRHRLHLDACAVLSREHQGVLTES